VGSPFVKTLTVDLQLASALTGVDLVEHVTGLPHMDDLAAGTRALDPEGMLAIPDAPGLGLELDPYALEKYTRETF
jgi:L-alanine-DL-glutamate epimerase-like enolase superfamily enzyme